jgi:hypothetical protein
VCHECPHQGIVVTQSQEAASCVALHCRELTLDELSQKRGSPQSVQTRCWHCLIMLRQLSESCGSSRFQIGSFCQRTWQKTSKGLLDKTPGYPRVYSKVGVFSNVIETLLPAISQCVDVTDVFRTVQMGPLLWPEPSRR